MPISGTVVEVNEDAVNTPEILNESPLEKGWLIKVDFTGSDVELSELLDYKDYKEEVQ